MFCALLSGAGEGSVATYVVASIQKRLAECKFILGWFYILVSNSVIFTIHTTNYDEI